MPLVTSGVEHGNIRELIQQRMSELGLACRDVRTREVGIKHIHHKIWPQQVSHVASYVVNALHMCVPGLGILVCCMPDVFRTIVVYFRSGSVCASAAFSILISLLLSASSAFRLSFFHVLLLCLFFMCYCLYLLY